MLTLAWFVVLCLFLLLLVATGRGPRLPGGMSWFDMLPYLPESKKAKGRMQQRPKKRR